MTHLFLFIFCHFGSVIAPAEKLQPWCFRAPSLLSPLWKLGHSPHPNYVIQGMTESGMEGQGHVFAHILISSPNNLSLFFFP